MSIWEQWSNVPLKNRTFVGKKNVFLIFLGANFVAPKSRHQCDKQPVLGQAWEYQPKSKGKIYVQKRFVRYGHQIFCFLLFYISFYISRYHFPKNIKTSFNIIWKNIFQRIHSTSPHHFNSKNSLSMMKLFCQCSLIFFGDQTSNIPDGTKIHGNIIYL